jgi:hypothetical protein
LLNFPGCVFGKTGGGCGFYFARCFLGGILTWG